VIGRKAKETSLKRIDRLIIRPEVSVEKRQGKTTAGLRRVLFLGLLLGAAAVSAQTVPVSVYYYPWYSGANWDQNKFLRGKNRMDIPPLIGTYDNAVNKVSVRQHIEWSTNFGIDNWICSWWGPNSYQSNAILKNIMPNLAGTNLTFCLFYETSSFYGSNWTFGPTEVQLFYDHIKYMNDNFFSSPSYWKIGGRPVVVVYLSRQMGGAYADALTRVRKDFNVYLIGDDFHFGPAEPARHKNWDAITIYNSHGLKIYDGYPKTTGFIEGARKNFQNHKKGLVGTATKLMSNVIPGYNDRAQRLDANNYPIPRRVAADSAEGSTFNQMLTMGLEEGDPEVGTAICSWNEWWEDSEIEPTVVSPPTNKDGTADFTYSKGYMYEGYGATLLKMLLAKAGRNAAVAPSLAVKAPAAAAAWAAGSQQTITWDTQGIIYYVNLEYLNAGSWVRIATQAENTGSFKWTVPANAAQPVSIRVSTVEGVTFNVSGTPAAAGRAGGIALAPQARSLGGTVSFRHLDGVRGISILGMSGRIERKLRVDANTLEWDGRNAAGTPVPQGVYRAVFSGAAGSLARPVVITR
jgi:hypothetical protein